MFKPSATLHKSPSGVLSVLVCSENANDCLVAYKTCTEPGQVAYLRNGHLDRYRKIPIDIKVAKPKASKKTVKSKKTILQ